MTRNIKKTIAPTAVIPKTANETNGAVVGIAVVGAVVIKPF